MENTRLGATLGRLILRVNKFKAHLLLMPDEHGSREEMIQTGNVVVNWCMTGHDICQW